MKLNNKYYILRHGQAVSNVKEVVSCWPEKFENPLTERGVAMIEKAADELKGKKINFIFASDLLRTKQTAEIVSRSLNNMEIEFDERIREFNFGAFNGGPLSNYLGFETDKERISKRMPEGENYSDLLGRVYDFLQDIDKKYKNKVILIISHECPLWLLESKVKGLTLEEAVKISPDERIHKGQIRELN